MKKWLLWLLPVILLVGLVVWRFDKKAEESAQLQQGGPGGGPAGAGGGPRAGGGAPGGGAPGGGGGGGSRRGGAVELASAGPRVIVTTFEYVGTVEAPFRVQISPRSSGRIEYLNAREGDRVAAGQVLVRIDPAELQAAVLQQEAAVAEARSRLAQAQIQQAPAEANVAGQLQQQRATLVSEQANLNQVRRNYDAQVASAEAGVADANARVRSAQAQVDNAQAALEREQANLKNAQTRLARTESLYRQGFIAAQDVDDARTAADVQARSVEVAQSQIAAARAAVASAQAQLKSAQNQVSIVRRQGQSSIAAGQAKVTQARAGVDIAGANRAQNPAYRQNLAALGSSVRAAEAQLAQARARLAETSLRSPINGVVTQRTGDVGSLAAPGTPVLVVQNIDWVFVNTSVPIEQGQRMRVGTPASITFDAVPGRVFTGKVSNVNPAADVQSRQFSVRIRLENPGGTLKPGMFGNVRFVADRIAAAVAVPREAVTKTRQGSTVAVLGEDEKAQVRDVTLGASDDQFIQILSGVKSGERVVTLSFQPVRDGQEIRTGGEGQGGRSGGARGGGGG